MTDEFNEKPFVMKSAVSARKQHKTALNSITKNVVQSHEIHIQKNPSEFSIKYKCELNDQLKDKLSANEHTLNKSKNILVCSPSSADQSLNTKNIFTRNKEVKYILEIQCVEF